MMVLVQGSEQGVGQRGLPLDALHDEVDGAGGLALGALAGPGGLLLLLSLGG